MEYLAKSDGTTLVDHVELMIKFAHIYCDIIEVDDKYRNILIRAIILHDIGKIKGNFQEILKTNGACEIKSYSLHHIDSYSFIMRTFKSTNENNIMANAVYWHHAKLEAKKGKKVTNITPGDSLGGFTKIDFDNCDDYSNIMLKKHSVEMVLNKGEIDSNDIKEPKYYDGGYDMHQITLIRGLLVSIDRMASSYGNDEVLELLMDNSMCYDIIIEKDFKKPFKLSKPDLYDEKRFNDQTSHIEEISSKNTVTFKATAGGGKTSAALRVFSGTDRKCLIVSTRNIIARNNYDSIIKELGYFNQTGLVSVELFLTGKREACTDVSIPIFGSDIVITNIDNMLKPTIDSSVGDRQVSLFVRDIFFDEFHESVSSDALFAGFVNIMKVRNKLIKSKTVLLSATPKKLEPLWDGDKINKTCVYLSDKEHLPAVHDKKYEIQLYAGTHAEVKKHISDNLLENSLILMNSISNSQVIYNDIKCDYLVHSEFNRGDVNLRRELLNKTHGKKSNDYSSIFASTPILEASMDVSFNNIYISLSSVDSLLQIIGRCNRWGTFDNSKIFIYNINDRSEDTAIGINYSKDLSNKLYNYLLRIQGKTSFATLNELYVLYNSFNGAYSKDIKLFTDEKYRLSDINLSKIYPHRSPKDEKSSMLTNVGIGYTFSYDETLRGNNQNSINYIVKRLRNNEMNLEVHTKEITGFGKIPTAHEFFDDEDKDSLYNARKIIKRLPEKTFKYSRNFKKGEFTLAQMERGANKKETPYIATKYYYEPDFGIISQRTINKFDKPLRELK